jgi:ribosomal protein L37AE/L43A
MRRHLSGNASRVGQSGLARFVLTCHACGVQQVVSSLPTLWQCQGCQAAFTVSGASYVPHDTYYARRESD